MRSLPILGIVVADVALATAQLGKDNVFSVNHLWLPLGFTTVYVLFFAYQRYREPKGRAESILTSCVCVLTGIGLAALAGIDSNLAFRQLVWLTFGLASFGLIAYIPLWDRLRKYTYVWALAGFILLLWPMMFGVEIRGARSWVAVGPLGFQPGEFAKIFFVLALSSYLAKTRAVLATGPGLSRARAFSWQYLGPIFLIVLLFIASLTLQRDLGTALILFGLVVGMVTVATASIRYFFGGIGLLCGASLGAVSVFDHVRTRFILWIDPWPYVDGRGYQIVESMFALASGGLIGTGWGKGMADRIPIVESDFIYSLIVEESGLLGAAGVLILLAVVCMRMIVVATDKSHDDMLRLAAVGFGLLLAIQTFLIVGGVTRLLPVTGVTLPFVSYGGSSLIATFALTGLVYNLYVSPSKV